MDHFSAAGTLFYGRAYPRIACGIKSAIQELMTNPLCKIGARLLRQIINDFLEIGEEKVAEDYLVVHRAIDARACSRV